jgi:hypothetical protein
VVVGASPLTMLKWLRLIHDDAILIVTVGGGVVMRMTDLIDGGRAKHGIGIVLTMWLVR